MSEAGHTTNHPHHGQRVVTAGKPLKDAHAAMILVHGRGDMAESALELAGLLPHPEMTYLAPQAARGTWYPLSFLAPVKQNEPHLSSAINVLSVLVAQIEDAGIPAEKIVFGGFSQGACLASEFVARNARRYGGLIVFSGGLIGPPGTARNYRGSLDGTPVFIGCSDQDAHIPEARVHETADVLAALGGAVTKRIYPGMGHRINQDEIDEAARLVADV